jgi:hypothetical protein
MKTLQEHFNLIKEGKGNKAQFLKQARSLFPEYFNQYTDFDTATNVLKSKQIINEAAGGVVAKGFSVYDWKKILGEEVKAMEKETSKEVLDKQAHAYQPSNMKDADNINFNEIMKGFFAEMYDEKNKEKTGDEIKAMVVKNLAKDPLYYTKNGNFSTMGVGYIDEAPGLGKPKEPKGKFKSSGYGDIEKAEKVKSNVQDSLGDSEAKTSMPKKVKEMPDKGVSGIEKKMKLQENKETSDEKITRYEKYTYILDDKEVKPDEIAFYDHLLGAEIDGKFYKIGIPSEDGKVKLTLRENKETSDEKIARYKKYTYTLDGKEVKPDDIDFYDHLLGAKMGDRFYRIGIPSEDGKVKLKLREAVTGENPYFDTDPSDGDFEQQDFDKNMAYDYYDKGMEAYSEGDYLKADKYLAAARKIGSYLGWGEQELPSYDNKLQEEQKLRSLIRNLINEELNK